MEKTPVDAAHQSESRRPKPPKASNPPPWRNWMQGVIMTWYDPPVSVLFRLPNIEVTSVAPKQQITDVVIKANSVNISLGTIQQQLSDVVVSTNPAQLVKCSAPR